VGAAMMASKDPGWVLRPLTSLTCAPGRRPRDVPRGLR